MLDTEHNIYSSSAVPQFLYLQHEDRMIAAPSLEGTQTDGWIPREEQTHELLAGTLSWAVRHHHIPKEQLPLESYSQQGTEFDSSDLDKCDWKKSSTTERI